jgi:hypothetical protein
MSLSSCPIVAVPGTESLLVGRFVAGLVGFESSVSCAWRLNDLIESPSQ